ncbi:silent information regulator protein Sir2 [Nitzschia inconspicua]|uniref:Silent information regulator protein Sir2 n=1 Tax=Nitzschia inconspicua TaxID=303405 RepID=A0A9K3L1Y1_9STRA|nr:silent information regulator protein Sir2 [Nitzschia inconspicua]KAG7359529.1 silent information regulator protein Sir2 [Nitzschia inconspicua]
MPPTTRQSKRKERRSRGSTKRSSSNRSDEGCKPIPADAATTPDPISSDDKSEGNVVPLGTSEELSSSGATALQVSPQSLPTSKNSSRRRSSRGNSSLYHLAQAIVEHQKHVLFITGAGISVASGIRPFRGPTGVWTHHIWTNSTREAFRGDPLEWYNDFWLQCLGTLGRGTIKPNAGHEALEILLRRFPFTLMLITQNVDGLHPPGPRTIEAHGRLGLFKCMPDEDSDTDSDSDTDDDRLVHLGHRRKHSQSRSNKCPFRQQQSLTVDHIEPPVLRQLLREGKGPLPELPCCPVCNNIVAPQALLFDEGYHSHDFYQFRKMEDWLSKAEVVVFVGTSFAVRLPEVTLEHCRKVGIPVYNFNTCDMLLASAALNASNIRGPAEVTLPLLLREVDELQRTLDHPEPVRANAQAGDKPPRLRRSSRRTWKFCT